MDSDRKDEKDTIFLLFGEPTIHCQVGDLSFDTLHQAMIDDTVWVSRPIRDLFDDWLAEYDLLLAMDPRVQLPTLADMRTELKVTISMIDDFMAKHPGRFHSRDE